MAGIVVENEQGLVGRNMRVGLSVLVVDDDPSALLIAKRILTTKQYIVTTASGGSEALRLLNISNGQFDLILSDLYMPGMDGFQLLQVVRALYNIPFLFMSSDHRLDVMKRGLEAGARYFFPKPLTIMDYECIWQFVYIENVEYFQGIDIDEGHQGPPPPPLSPPQDRQPNSLSISDDIRTLGRSSSSSSSYTSKGKKRRQDENHDNKRQKRPYKKRVRKEDQDFEKKTAVVPIKNKRVVWTTQLHEKFLQALRILKMARKRAVPKRIHALMKVRGLSRENIASHLQKYRLNQNKYKGTSESDCPPRRIRMRLPEENEYHDYSPSHDHSNDYQNRAQSSLQLANQTRLHVKDNFCRPYNLNVPVARPQYHSQEGSNDNFMAQANYGPTAVTNMGDLGRPWMSDAPTMNQSNVGAYQSLYGTSAPLYGNDLNIGSITNAIPIMAEQQIPQGMKGFLPNAPIDDPNFGNLGFESLQNSSPSVDTENKAPFGVGSRILTGTIGGEIPNDEKVADICRMDEICKGNKPIGEAKDEFSLSHDPLYFNGINSNLTSQGESFVENPNYATVGESSTRALVKPHKLQQGNEVNNSGWLNSVDDIADFLLNQASEKTNEEEGDGYKNPNFDPWGFLQDGDSNPGAI